jgi:hypothetical protein
MRNTSWRRRSGFKITGDLSRMGAGVESIPMVEILEADDPDAIQCQAPGCGVWVRRLTNGRPRGHAAGGQTTSVRWGRYKCEGSGVT